MIPQDLIEKIEKLAEVEHYLFIEECGGFIWTMNHGMSHGEIPDVPSIHEDIKTVREIQEYIVSKLGKFGVNPESATEPKETSDYWKWYNFWHEWHHEILSNDDWQKVNRKLSLGEDISEFLPKSKWNETEIIL